jgi:hypothetical protein
MGAMRVTCTAYPLNGCAHPQFCQDQCVGRPIRVERDTRFADWDKQRALDAMNNAFLAWDIAGTWLMLINPRHAKYSAVVDLFINAQANAIGWASR